MERRQIIVARRQGAVKGSLLACLSAFGLLIAYAGAADGKVASLMGSADFHPTMEHPMGWRGDGTGRFPGATPVTEWSATKNVRWSTQVGGGYASPIVVGELVVVASEPNVLVAVNRADGTLRWKVEMKPSDLTDPEQRKFAEAYQPPKDGSGLAAATPITDGHAVYAVLANGMVCAVDLDGKRRWTIGVTAEQSTAYGRSASPLLVGGKLIVHLTHLYALDPATGRQLWVNEEAKSLYGTPAAMRVGDTEVLVTPNGDVFRSTDGKSVNSEIAHASYSSPMVSEGVVYFGDQSSSALRLDAKFKESTVWSGMLSGEVFGSPLVHEGVLFLTTGAGELFAFAVDGKGPPEPVIDRREIVESEGVPVAYASLTLAGKYLFQHSNNGETVVLEATREARLVSRNKLPGGSGASPVFSGSDVFLREGDKLYCLGH